MSPAAARLHAVVRGRVQGVGFRWFVVDEAGDRLTGWVRNLRDGSVEVTAEGPPDELDRLETALRTGPSSGHVSGVVVDREPASGGLPPFEIRPTG